MLKILVNRGWHPALITAIAVAALVYKEWPIEVVVPILIVILLIAFEICLGLMFIIKRKYLKIALILGILFCLASMPAMIEAIYTNLPLALIQAFLLWNEFRLEARKNM